MLSSIGAEAFRRWSLPQINIRQWGFFLACLLWLRWSPDHANTCWISQLHLWVAGSLIKTVRGHWSEGESDDAGHGCVLSQQNLQGLYVRVHLQCVHIHAWKYGQVFKYSDNVVLRHIWSRRVCIPEYTSEKVQAEVSQKKRWKTKVEGMNGGGPGEVRRWWPSGEGNNDWSFARANNKGVARWLIGESYWL